MSRALRSLLLVALVPSAVFSPALRAQSPTKSPGAGAADKPTLGAADYAKWETLGGGALSPDGKWIAYDFRRGDGSTELRYRSLASTDDVAVHSANGGQFSGNGRWLLYTVTPDTAGAAARGGRGGRGGAGAGANHNKVAVVDLSTGQTQTFDDVQSYSLRSDGSHVALRRYATPGKRGADVIVRDLAAGTELTFGNVAEQSWNDDGGMLAMAIDVDGHTGDGVQVLNTKTGVVRSLDASDALYSGLVWRSHSDDLAVMRSRGDTTYADTGYAVVAWRDVAAAATKQSYDYGTDKTFPATMRVAAYRPPQWSADGSTLILGVAPHEYKIVPERRAPGELGPARVQIWHSKDLREFHQQEVSAAQDRQRTTPAVWHVGAAGVVHLSNDPFETIQYSDNGQTVLANDESPYSREYMSGRATRDIYRVDLSSGRREEIVPKSLFTATLSPSGRFVLYQQGAAWWSLDLSNGKRSNLTSGIKSVFVNMEDDHPVPERRAYGIAGFTTGETSAIVYDRFDLWRVNLDGSSPLRLTRGREDSTVYRCISEGFGGGGRGGRGGAAATPAPCSLDGEGKTIDTSKPLILSAAGEYNKKSGYAKLTVGPAAQRMIWLDKSVTRLVKAKDADVYLMEEQTAEDPPNFYVAGDALSDARQASHVDDFQSNYAWGKQVLLPYTNKRGDKLQMMLTYPADYRPGRKYPMVVYYYEKLSQGFHQYVTPSDRSPYNTTVFSQNGYFVLRPDVVFQFRNPGYSGLDCVTSAVSAVLAKVPDIDGTKVGNMGHSWGGYQSAFYAVHNHGTFAATIAGAPLTDLISMYGYTSGNSGLPETGHYETSQERMQVPLWEDPQAYIRNSTVFAVDSLHTPLLLEEGDADGNVNHFQSEELYNFGRRLGKTVVYLVYEGENHNVARPESQHDYLARQLEWFGHYLKGEPIAEWMAVGETYLTRQRTLKSSVPAGGGAAAPVQPAAGGRRGGGGFW